MLYAVQGVLLRVEDPVEDPEALEGSAVEGLYAPRSLLYAAFQRDMGFCLLTGSKKRLA
jgi:hypothetical protein